MRERSANNAFVSLWTRFTFDWSLKSSPGQLYGEHKLLTRALLSVTCARRGNNNAANCAGPLAGLGGVKSGGNTPMNPSLQQRINFLQNHLSQGPMPSIATKWVCITWTTNYACFVARSFVNSLVIPREGILRRSASCTRNVVLIVEVGQVAEDVVCPGKTWKRGTKLHLYLSPSLWVFNATRLFLVVHDLLVSWRIWRSI